jgi:hypothetical protein
MKTLAMCLALATLALTACQKKEDDGTPAASGGAATIKADSRVDAEMGRLNVGNWPPQAETLDAAAKDIEGKIGPGEKMPDGSLVWAGQSAKEPEKCMRITLKDVGGKLDASSEKLKSAHPEFAACTQLAAKQAK